MLNDFDDNEPTKPDGVPVMISGDPSRDTCWLTRDASADGVYSPYIDVWVARPDRRAAGRASYWVDGGRAGHPATVHERLENISLAECRRVYGTIPDTDLMCIRVGHAPSPVPVRAVS